MSLNEKKLKELVEKIYVKELVGVNIFEHIADYQQLNNECNQLIDVACKYEVAVITKQEYVTLKLEVEKKINTIHQLASAIPMYRMSHIYFNDDGALTGLY